MKDIMRRAFCIVISALMVMMLFSSCSDAKRIVGTWELDNSRVQSAEMTLFGKTSRPAKITWIFNSDGTGTSDGKAFSYSFASNGDIYISGWGEGTLFWSSNGRTLTINFKNSSYPYVFTKK